MPTVIAVEAHPVGIGSFLLEFEHLYLVKTTTDESGRVLDERVIRGSLGDEGRLRTLADIDLAASPDRRGSDTPEERHHTELDLDGRSAAVIHGHEDHELLIDPVARVLEEGVTVSVARAVRLGVANRLRRRADLHCRSADERSWNRERRQCKRVDRPKGRRHAAAKDLASVKGTAIFVLGDPPSHLEPHPDGFGVTLGHCIQCRGVKRRGLEQADGRVGPRNEICVRDVDVL